MTSPLTPPAYGALLARVHHEGFGDPARAAARTLLAELGSAGIASGTVVDLGCGSGILSRAVSEAGYDAVGFDLSPEMLELAREHAPGASFVRSTLAEAEIPPCVAVAVVGECFNYTFDDGERDVGAGLEVLETVAAGARAVLAPGGILLLDFATPGRVGPEPREGEWEEGEWRVNYRAVEDPRARTLVRTITSTRTDTEGREVRSEESHALVLFDPDDVALRLDVAGFEVERLAEYDGFALPPGWSVLLGRAE